MGFHFAANLRIALRGWQGRDEGRADGCPHRSRHLVARDLLAERDGPLKRFAGSRTALASAQMSLDLRAGSLVDLLGCVAGQLFRQVRTSRRTPIAAFEQS
jgi:hypothetical protein